jgi:hypothetical protein
VAHRGKAALLAVLLFAISGSASAQSPAQDRALAESLFRSAKGLVGEGNFDEACPKFAESQRLDPQLGTLLHLATCHEQQGKTATAWIEFTEAATIAASKNEERREAIARDRADALEKRLSRIQVMIDGSVDDLEVRLDGKAIGSASLRIAIPVDPGEHRIDAGAPGRQAWSRSIDVKPGPALETITIPKLEEGSGEMRPLDGDDDPERAQPGDAERDDGSTQRTVGFVIGGAGLAGVVVGAVFGGVAASQASDADELCEGSLCTQQGLDMHDEASDSATVSTVLFGVGLAAVAAGVVIVLTAPSGADGDNSALQLPPTLYLRPTLTGVSFGGRW